MTEDNVSRNIFTQMMNYELKYTKMKYIRIIVLNILWMLLAVPTFAYNFEVDGLCYNIISDNEVEVTYRSFEDGSYSGKLNIPANVTSNGKNYVVTKIGNFAFYNCSGLTGSLTIPNSVTTIGGDAFFGCSGLTGSLTIPNSVTSIGGYAFCNCSGFTGPLTIPNSVTSISGGAFDGCSGFTGPLTIPNSVTSIGDYAFSRCSGFTGSLTIPNSVTSIGNFAFSRCSGFTGDLTIPNSVTTIGGCAFEMCSGFTGPLTIPNSVTSIGGGAFYGCSGFTGPLTIPNSVTSISGSAFYGCSGLTGSLTIPNSVTTIGVQAFCYCSGFTGSLTIPNSVTTIGRYAFSGCSGFTGPLTIPNSVTTIGGDAFLGCSGFTGDLTIPNSVTTIGANAFGGCSGFTGSLTIPNSVTSIGTCAFFGCSGFTGDLTIPNSVTSIGDEAFRGCSGFTGSLTIPNSVTIIGVQAFYNCSGFTGSLTIPNSVTSIGGYAFYGCSGLTSVTIDNSVKEIGSHAFSWCQKVSNVISKITEPFSIDEEVFSYISSNAVLQIPSGTTSKYQQYSGWTKNFKEIIEEGGATITTYKLSIKATGNGSVSYNGTSVRNTTETFTVDEGTMVSISLIPDNGYKIKNVKVNNTDVTSNVSNNQYTISNITANTTLEVAFEAIPTYSLSITASGSGSATYNGTAVRGKTQAFTVREGTSATVTFTPDAGYRIKNVKLDNTDVTASVANNSYTISNITANTTLTVTFEEIPPTTYTFTISAVGNGTVTYDGNTIKGKTSSFTVVEGTNVVVTFSADEGYRLKSVKLNATDVTASVANNQYTISNIKANTSLEVEFEAIPITTYTLSIKATGNGYVAYDGNIVRGKTSSFTVNEGTNATIKFSADEGNRLESVKLNGIDITYDITGNQYVVSNISANTSIEVVFEAIPTYSLNITATGDGSVTYHGTSIRNQSLGFALQEGSSAVISITPDSGYRIASVKVNSEDATSRVANGKLTIADIQQDTNVEVTFEAIPATTCTLSITATGNGVVTYDGKNVRNQTSSFTVAIGTYATVLFAADEGYRLKRVTLDGKDVTADVANDQYTTSKLMTDAVLLVEFEAVPTYSMTVKSSKYGSVRFGDEVVKNETKTFSITEGASAVLTFTPDNNGRLQSVTLNGTDITQQLSNGQYTISDIRANQDVEAVFTEDVTKVTYKGVAYSVTSYSNQTVVVAAGNYGNVLVVPASFTVGGITWKVEGVAEGALMDNKELAAVVWKPALKFTEKVSNPNLLLYVKEAQYASPDIQNVILGDMDNGETLLADNITLVETDNDNDFYCPLTFIAKHISYEHNYSMISGHKSCQGWETLVLPFDVSMMVSPKGRELVPYTSWKHGSNLRPYWLYELTADGWKAANGIKANTPYIISMPNNEAYESSYNITGDIQFVGYNVQVVASDKMTNGQYGNKRLVANYRNQKANNGIYALNVNNRWNNNTDTSVEGSAFIRGLRQVRPFEAYMALEGGNAGIRAIPVFGNETTGIMTLPTTGLEDADAIYNLNGQRVNSMSRGIYIQNGRKVVKKK